MRLAVHGFFRVRVVRHCRMALLRGPVLTRFFRGPIVRDFAVLTPSTAVVADSEGLNPLPEFSSYGTIAGSATGLDNLRPIMTTTAGGIPLVASVLSVVVFPELR